MTQRRFLIVNADDFGQSSGVNRGIVEAHERGIVTSASLMVRWPASAEAAAYARRHPELSIGLHVDLGEWAYRDEAWVQVYDVVPTDDVAAVTDEVSRQLATFRELVGREPTPIDSHQHVHEQEPVRTIALEMATKLGVPLRNHSPRVDYCADFYGQTTDGSPLPENITTERLLEILAQLSAGITEVGCHPGREVDQDTMYRGERDQEVRTLCDPRIRSALAAAGIELQSFLH